MWYTSVYPELHVDYVLIVLGKKSLHTHTHTHTHPPQPLTYTLQTNTLIYTQSTPICPTNFHAGTPPIYTTHVDCTVHSYHPTPHTCMQTICSCHTWEHPRTSPNNTHIPPQHNTLAHFNTNFPCKCKHNTYSYTFKTHTHTHTHTLLSRTVAPALTSHTVPVCSLTHNIIAGFSHKLE